MITNIHPLQIAVKRSTIKRAITISILVGSLLNLINQGDFILSEDWSHLNFFKIALTYVTPFMVSVYSTTTALMKAKIPYKNLM